MPSSTARRQPQIPTAPRSHPRAPPATPPAERHRPAGTGVPPSPSDRPSRSPAVGSSAASRSVPLVGALVAGGIVAVAEHDDGRRRRRPAGESARGVAAGRHRGVDGRRRTRIAALVQRGRSRRSWRSTTRSRRPTSSGGTGRGPGRRHRLRAQQPTATSSPTTTSSTGRPTSPSTSATARTPRRRSSPPTPAPTSPCSRSTAPTSRPLPLGNSDDLQIGDQVVAIGNALDLSGGPTVTTGIVSATGRSLDEPNGTHLDEPAADRHRDQPRQLRRPAARHAGRGRRHQHGDRRTGPEHRLRHRHRPGQGADRPAAERQGARPTPCSASSPSRCTIGRRRGRRRVAPARRPTTPACGPAT